MVTWRQYVAARQFNTRSACVKHPEVFHRAPCIKHGPQFVIFTVSVTLINCLHQFCYPRLRNRSKISGLHLRQRTLSGIHFEYQLWIPRGRLWLVPHIHVWTFPGGTMPNSLPTSVDAWRRTPQCPTTRSAACNFARLDSLSLPLGTTSLCAAGIRSFVADSEVRQGV